MKKTLMILIVIIIILVLGIGTYFLFSKKDISKMRGDKLDEYTLQQKEVIEFIGEDEILDGGGMVAPSKVFTQENYDTIKNLEPSCLEDLKIGDEIRVVTYYIETHEISVVWSLKKNKIVCIFASPRD
jgi:uncharacterized membrane protein